MDLNEARRIYSNLRPVHDIMGGDLVSACLAKGIPPAMLYTIMIEWGESESRMNRVLGVLRDDRPRQISDELMKRFEDLHDPNGALKSRRKRRS
jgi:hypothetical protein